MIQILLKYPHKNVWKEIALHIIILAFQNTSIIVLSGHGLQTKKCI